MIGNRFCKDCKWVSYKNNAPFFNNHAVCTNIDKIGWNIKPEIRISKITGKTIREKGRYKYCSNERGEYGKCGSDSKFFELASREDIIKKFFFDLGSYDLFMTIMIVWCTFLWGIL